MDRLSRLLASHSFSCSIFYQGDFCGSNDFSGESGIGQIHLVRRGTVSMFHDDSRPIYVDMPALVFYPRGMGHRLYVPPGSTAQLLCANIQFHGGPGSLLAKALPDHLLIPIAEPTSLQHILSILFEEADAPTSGQRIVMDRLCDVLVVHLLRHAVQTKQLSEALLSGFSDPALSAALTAIHDDPAKPWTVESLARLCNMSRSKFAKYFHDVIGTPPADYVTDRRMLLAKKLLRSNKPIKVVAEAVGYAHQPAFTKAFTARVGVSPLKWHTCADLQNQ